MLFLLLNYATYHNMLDCSLPATLSRFATIIVRRAVLAALVSHVSTLISCYSIGLVYSIGRQV